jgi:hypothetical protein
VLGEEIPLTLVDDQVRPVVGAWIEALEVANGTQSKARTNASGRVGLAAAEYVLWIHGDGILEELGHKIVASEATIICQRPGQVALRFEGNERPREGIRAKLLLESLPGEEERARSLRRAELRRQCFEGQLGPHERAMLAGSLGRTLPVGWVANERDAEQASDGEGRITWRKMPAGRYRWELCTPGRVAFDPPFELAPVTESLEGRLQIHSAQTNLSGAFELHAGESISLTSKLLRGARVHGVVLGEGNQPAVGARVSLQNTIRSRRSNDTARTAEAYARTSAHGTFEFENVSPGEKLVFAILDDPEHHELWLSPHAVEFTLAEEEDRDLGTISISGAVVEFTAKIAATDGTPLDFADVFENADLVGQVSLLNDGAGRSYGTSFLLHLGGESSYRVHGLEPFVIASLSEQGLSDTESDWKLRKGYRRVVDRDPSRRFDPYQTQRVELEVPIDIVQTSEVAFLVPAGTTLDTDTNLLGIATRIPDGKRYRFNLDWIAEAKRWAGDASLPAGRYEYIVSPSYSLVNLFARGEFEVPFQSPFERVLEPGTLVRGALCAEDGVPVPDSRTRVGFAGMSENEWWTSVRANRFGEFTLGGVPPGSELVFERSNDRLRVGATNLENVRLILSRP